MNIAICDNDHACAEKTAALLKRYLSREQDTLTVFKNSGDLLQAAEKTPFDVLFLEIRLKGMDGLAAAARIRALHSRAIILFVSSYHLVRIEPGRKIGNHVHRDQLETHEVIAGAGSCINDGAPLVYTPGVISIFPAGLPHEVTAGPEGLYLFAKFMPALN